MLSALKTITINNYKNSNCISLKTVKTFNNILFLKHQIDKPFIDVLNEPNNYLYIKQTLLNLLPEDTRLKIDHALSDLEIHGFNSFSPYKTLNKTLKNMITQKYKFLLEDIYICSYFKICSNTPSTIFTKSHTTLLHGGILKFMEVINSDFFVPYTIFDNDPYNNLIMYQTNNYLKTILVATSDTKSVLSHDEMILLCNLSTTLINSLGEFLNISTKDLKIDLILYMSSSKKLCPVNKGQEMSYEHVNSGSTTYYYDTTYADPIVKLYRTEELVKVLFHELIHACKFDQLFDKYPKHAFKVTRKQLLFTESITECFARIINIIIYSHIYNEKMMKMLDYEIQFGLIQTAKIFDSYGFKSVNDFLNEDSTKTIKQETSAFEYYILTTILLIKIEEFLTIVKTKGTIANIVTLIETTFMDITYQNKIDYLIKNIKKIDNVIIKTCKMTVIRIDPLNVINYNKCKANYLEHKNCKLT